MTDNEINEKMAELMGWREKESAYPYYVDENSTFMTDKQDYVPVRNEQQAWRVVDHLTGISITLSQEVDLPDWYCALDHNYKQIGASRKPTRAQAICHALKEVVI